MTSHCKLTVALLATFLSAFSYASAATAPPKVAFVGDWLTDGWSATFPANWINDGDCCNSGNYNPQQIAAAIAQKPSIIHIMVGSAYLDDDASYNLVTALMEEALIQMITQAQAAGIPVILGIEPKQFAGPQGLLEMDDIVYAVATKYSIPYINYNGAFNGTAQGFGYANGSLIGPLIPLNQYSQYQPTPAGYTVMTMMAQTAFATLNAQPNYLYLQDTLEGTPNGGVVTSNVNTVSPGNTVQFYPVIFYNNGVSAQAGFNTNYVTGSNGTWTSSDPTVGYVNQFGTFNAFNQGTTTVKFTLPNGVWNEWIMYVGAPSPGE
jgi:hypothetical protein